MNIVPNGVLMCHSPHPPLQPWQCVIVSGFKLLTGFISCSFLDGTLSSGDDSCGERGLLHIWKGYSCSVTPERTLLSRPVLQVALGTYHGLLLVEGILCSFLIVGVKRLTFLISDFLGFLIDSS